jgi:hypothetical protein
MPDLFRILQDDELIDASGIDSQFQTRRFGIGDEPRFVSGIDPGSGDDFRAVSRRTGFLVFNLATNIVLGENAFFKQ